MDIQHLHWNSSSTTNNFDVLTIGQKPGIYPGKYQNSWQMDLHPPKMWIFRGIQLHHINRSPCDPCVTSDCWHPLLFPDSYPRPLRLCGDSATSSARLFIWWLDPSLSWKRCQRWFSTLSSICRKESPDEGFESSFGGQWPQCGKGSRQLALNLRIGFKKMTWTAAFL